MSSETPSCGAALSASDAPLSIRAIVDGGSAGRPRLDVSMHLSTEITAITGPSAAGKTTLLMSIAGLVVPTTGRITLGQRVLFDSSGGLNLAPHVRRVAIVFQSLALFPHMSVWQNVAYGLRPTGAAHRRERALHWLARMRAEPLADRSPATLSGGEAQRVALARALASVPQALLLDEPFSALDSGLRLDLGQQLQELVGELNIPTLLVTHDLAEATRLGTRTLELREGRLLP